MASRQYPQNPVRGTRFAGLWSCSAFLRFRRIATRPCPGAGSGCPAKNLKVMKRHAQFIVCHFCLLSALIAPGDIRAAKIYWGGGVSTDWFVAGNWLGGGVPTSGDIAYVYGTRPQIGGEAAVANGVTIGGSLFSSDDKLFVTTGGSLTTQVIQISTGYGNAALEVNGGGQVTATYPNNGGISVGSSGPSASYVSHASLLVTGANSRVTANGGAVIVSPGQYSEGTVTVADGGLLRAGAIWAGYYPGGIATVNLNGTAAGRGVIETSTILESYGSGAVNMDGGIARATASIANFFQGLDAGEVKLLAGGGFFDTQSYNVGVAGVLAGVGSFTKLGAGTLTLSGANTHEGGTIVNAGLVQFSSLDSLGSGAVTLDGGGLRWATGNTVDVSARLGALGSGGATFDTNDNNVTLSSVLTGSGGLIKTGLGTLTLEGTNTYSGGTTVNAGTLHGSAASLQGAIINNATVAFGQTAAGAYTGVMSGTGAIIKLGAGTLSLSTDNTYTGSTTVSEGTLKLTGNSRSPAFAIASGATFEFGAAIDYAVDTLFTGAGTLRKTGAGGVKWTTAAATFALSSGSLIDVQGGTFTAGSFGNENWTSNLSSLNVAAGASFEAVEANVRVDAITGAGVISSGYDGTQVFTFGVNNGSGEFSGKLTNNPIGGAVAAFTKSGSGAQILSGASTYTGATTVDGGKLVVDGSLSAGSQVTVNRGAEIGGHGTVGAILVASGGSTYPGDPQILTATSIEYQTGSTARFAIETTSGSPQAGLNYDRIALTGETNGVLEIASGTTLELYVTDESLDYLQMHPLGSYFLFTLGDAAASGVFDALTITLNGSATIEQIIDGTAVFSALGLEWLIGYTGDAATNSLTGGHDVTLSVASAVPEPGAGALLAVGGLGWFAVARRKSNN